MEILPEFAECRGPTVPSPFRHGSVTVPSRFRHGSGRPSPLHQLSRTYFRRTQLRAADPPAAQPRDVEFSRVVLEAGPRVADDELEARVRESLRVLSQMLLAELNDDFVDVHHDTFRHAFVAEHLPRRAALAPSGNKYLLACAF